MNHKNAAVLITIVAFTILTLSILKRSSRTSESGKKIIGILQTASHPALDAVRKGFVDVIRADGNNNITYIERNGQGVISNIHAIAQQFHAQDKADIFFTIATPATQAMVAVEQDKPVIMAAVSLSLDSPLFEATNLCGISDMIDVSAEIDAMKKLLPTIKTVGIFYNNGEINSITMAQLMVNALQKTDITPLLIGVSSEVEIEPALLSAMPKVDAIITPIDNMVATSIALIVHIMEKVQKPLIVSDNMLVKEGALMSRGIDYYASGKQAGKIAIDIVMNNKTPDVINIIKSSTKQIFVNKQVAQKYNVIIPQDLEKDIIFV